MLICIIDFGLLVLIWLVQLVIYPSFKYYREVSLLKWHAKYTTNITVIVLPLMVAQLFLHGHQVYINFSILNLISFVLVALTWFITFAFAVPLHNNIAQAKNVVKSVEALVRVNWPRTVAWTVIFMISIYLEK